ncbi:hypothetical protein [Corallococcus exiguus]|uniref:hypothetical protein n=1 Tax=Corallococcus exiguus TaxID=83462 RepID=UPI003DA2F5A3
MLAPLRQPVQERVDDGVPLALAQLVDDGLLAAHPVRHAQCLQRLGIVTGQ